MLKFKRRIICYAVAYCPDCSGAVTIAGKKVLTESGRFVLEGNCPNCGLKLKMMTKR